MAHSKSDRIKVVVWYRDNGRNQEQTAKKFKVSTPTVRKWLKLHEDILNSAPNTSVIAKIEHSRAKNIIKFEEKQTEYAEKVCELAYERLKELIPQEKDVYKLVTLIDKLDPAKFVKKDDLSEQNGSNALSLILAQSREKWQSSQRVVDIEAVEVK